MAKPLTARSVEAEKPTDKRREIPDGGLPGLYLVVQPSGAKSWSVRYRRVDGKTRKLTLGKYPMLGLAEAREQGRAALRTATEGADPAADKRTAKAERNRNNVETLAAEFIRRHASKNKTGAETERIFQREVLPAWGGRDIGDIARRDVIELVDGIVDRGSPVMANRVLAAVRKFCNWCVARDVLEVAPTTGVKPPAKERARDRVLNDDELRWLWTATEKLGWPFGPLYRLLLLTGARREEVGEMSWREITGDEWTIPAGRAKNGKALTLKVTAPARDVLARLPEVQSPRRLVFTTNCERPVSGYSRAHERLQRLMLEEARKENPPAEIPHWTPHDLRRTMASGMARLGVPLPVIERVLNHVSGSFGGIVGVYQHHAYADEMADALERWAGFIVRLTEGGGTVVPMRA